MTTMFRSDNKPNTHREYTLHLDEDGLAHMFEATDEGNRTVQCEWEGNTLRIDTYHPREHAFDGCRVYLTREAAVALIKFLIGGF